MNAPTVRGIAEDEFAPFLNVVRTAFVSGPASEGEVQVRRAQTDLERCLGAFDGGGRLCGAAHAFATPLTVPGGEVRAGAVSGVGVLPTHRREGHLTRMMRAQLADIADRGETVAALIAAEYPIYGRYGYGPATEAVNLRLDAAGATWRDEPVGRVELVDSEAFAKLVDELYDRVRRAVPGHIGWNTARWRIRAGVDAFDDGEDAKRRDAAKVVWRDPAGEVGGAAMYSVDGAWDHNRPAGRLSTDALVAATAQADRELLRYLAAVDWVSEVHVGLRPVDHPAPLTLVDGRMAALTGRSDHVWLRVLDVPTALAARRYAAPGGLVVEVDDPLRFAGGRFRLDGGPDGAECWPTTEAADLIVPVAALGAAYLGGVGWQRLADGGWVDEARPGALARAAAMFATPRAPWCAMTF
ncbi:MAG TPA: GNAT family N-acetyltransferase [Acidimicrobiales bacterium]|nr:GNAT family N-acetyltransferase [Acidimicrobiales bacterium]